MLSSFWIYFNNCLKRAKSFLREFHVHLIGYPERVFLSVGLIMGITLVFITPPLQVADELAHFLRAYQVSDGRIFAIQEGDHAGGYIPKSILNWRDETEESIPIPYSTREDPGDHLNLSEDILSKINDDLNIADKEFFGFNSSAVYSPVPYIPQAVGINIGKLFSLSPLAIFYLGRLTNLFVAITLIYFAIKYTPILKWSMLLLGLMPITIFQLASLSADGFTISISFLLISLILRLTFSKVSKITSKSIFIIFICATLLALSKQAYIIIPFLISIIPVKKFKSLRHWFFAVGAVAFLSVLPSLLWTLYAKDLYDPANQVRIDYQRNYFLENPLKVAYQFFNNYYQDRSSVFDPTIGILGWGDTKLSFLFHIYPFSLLLFLVACFDKQKDIFIGVITKVKVALIVILNIFLITLTLFIFWTDPDAYGAAGITGRYFIPFLPLVSLLLYNKTLYCKNKNFQLFVFLFVVYSALVTILELIRTYYV